jgi:hypothetical protein
MAKCAWLRSAAYTALVAATFGVASCNRTREHTNLEQRAESHCRALEQLLSQGADDAHQHAGTEGRGWWLPPSSATWLPQWFSFCAWTRTAPTDQLEALNRDFIDRAKGVSDESFSTKPDPAKIEAGFRAMAELSHRVNQLPLDSSAR